ncbi:hypothetical protein [Endozoicomonas sp. 4G]|uniref:tyrosine-type recombinase/integrase n=1 Tax=Endozoicomonas sp. 4G TaxID=2872754 RepID=UPI002078C8B3|nr:hypothetical protein [Endozoicomonas sp. 4G]
MSRITDPDLKSLKTGKDEVESFGKGHGAMVFRKQGETTTGYYRYWKGRKSVFVLLGRYKPPRTKTAGFSLKEIREKATELATLRQQVSPQDLKEYLEQQEADRQQKAEERKQQEAIEASKGTFIDLIKLYSDLLFRKEASSARDVTTSLKTNVIKAHPSIANKKAADVTTDDIIKILGEVYARGCKTNYVRIRSYLQTAFNEGMKIDNDPLHLSEQGKRFGILFNPVSAIPRHSELENVRKRVLDNEEIRNAWQGISNGRPGYSPLYWLLIKLCFCLYGNRPKQLSRCLWEDVNFQQRTLTFIDRKGKNAKAKKRIIPLTDRAISVLREIQIYSGNNPGPFYIRNKVPISERNLSKFVKSYNDWLMQQARDQDEPIPEQWTAKDIRRTAIRLFTDCRVPREQRYLLQSREDGSVESKHYDHDDRLPEKRDTAKVYDSYLEKILTDTVPAKLVDLEHYRQLKGR